MKLVASLLVRNELDRYLPVVVEHLLSFCDEVRVLDDASTDGTSEWLTEVHDKRLQVRRQDRPSFYGHEGKTRQRLLDWTLAADPTHVLAIDADEFVTDPGNIREACQLDDPVWTLAMDEVWEIDGDCLCVREDGGWRPHPVPFLYAVPGSRYLGAWKIMERKLACGREPLAVRQQSARAESCGSDILHFGWTNPSERVARHARYAEHDKGNYHAARHLDSILWPPERVRLQGRPWPPALDSHREDITTRAAAPRRLEAPTAAQSARFAHPAEPDAAL